MLIFVESAHDVAVLRLTSRELTLYDKQTFQTAIEPFLSSNSRMLLDLQDVRTVDGHGIALLLECLHQLRAKGGDLKLLHVADNLRDFFEIARCHRLFEFHTSLREALDSFGPAASPLHGPLGSSLLPMENMG
jgi:anti-anti-sigma factor